MVDSFEYIPLTIDLAIMELVSKGYTNKEIARMMQCSPIAVKNRLRVLFRITKSRNRDHLMRKAFIRGWI